MFYISKTKAAFNPCDTNTPDTFISRGYDTREEAAEALEVIEAINTMLAEKSNLCIIEHDPNKMPTQRLRQERREKAFEILNDERSSTEEENGNSYVTLWQRLSQEECDTIYNAADGIDDWTSLLSIGGNGGKSYTSECELPEGNYTCVDVTVSVTNFISGFTAYFMK